MAKKVSPTFVGVFVLGALALAVVIIVALGSGRFFSGKQPYILYFDRDVNGLRVGAPVKFRGVDIGAVTAIQLSLQGLEQQSPNTEPNVKIPVVIELDSHQLDKHGAEDDLSDPSVMAHAIGLGLRGQLGMQSFVTGVLYVSLDMHPGTPATLVMGAHAPYEEIPTLPTPLEEAQETLGLIIAELHKADLPKLVKSLTDTATGISDFVKSEQLQDGVQSMRLAADNLRQTSDSMRQLSRDLDAQVGPLGKSLQQTATSADAALKEARVTLVEVQNTMAPESPFTYQLNQTLVEVSDASRSVKRLADYLERNPSAIVRGRFQGNR